jgi:hypothetical protein
MIHSQFSKLTLIASIALSLSLSACGGSKSVETDTPPPINNTAPPVNDTSPPVNTTEPLAGVWKAPAYGLVLDIQADTHQFYQITSEFCQRFELDLEHSELISNTQLSDDTNSIVTSLTGLKVPGMTMNKENSLPDICLNDLIANRGESNYQFDAQRDFEIFWQTFNEYYAFFDIEGVDWDEVFQLANNQISPQTTQARLIEILIDMVEPLQDFHVRVVNEQSGINFSVFRKPSLIDLAVQDFVLTRQVELPFNDAQVETFDIYFDEAIDLSIDAIMSHLVIDTDIEENVNGTLFWGKFDNNIGYVNFGSMDLEDFGASGNSVDQNKAILAENLDEIMQYFADVDGIIIDVRYIGRGSGDALVSLEIVSRFTEQFLTLYSKQARLGDSRTALTSVIAGPEGSTQFLGPVALMTSETTSGAAEIFAMSMRQRANTTLIGEATAGGFSDSLVKTLPHGTEYSLSNEFHLTPDNEEYEGVGVPVDIEQVFFTIEQREQGIDLGLEKAEEWIMQQQ